MKKTKNEIQKNKYAKLMYKFETKSEKIDKKWNKIYSKFEKCEDSIKWRKYSYLLDKLNAKKHLYNSIANYYSYLYFGIEEINL